MWFKKSIFLLLGLCFFSQIGFGREAKSLNEIQLLKKYAFINCVQLVYQKEFSKKHKIVKYLQKEGWYYVEKTSASPKTFSAIYKAAQKYAKKIPSLAATRACFQWKEGKKLHRLIKKYHR